MVDEGTARPEPRYCLASNKPFPAPAYLSYCWSLSSGLTLASLVVALEEKGLPAFSNREQFDSVRLRDGPRHWQQEQPNESHARPHFQGIGFEVLVAGNTTIVLPVTALIGLDFLRDFASKRRQNPKGSGILCSAAGEAFEAETKSSWPRTQTNQLVCGNAPPCATSLLLGHPIFRGLPSFTTAPTPKGPFPSSLHFIYPYLPGLLLLLLLLLLVAYPCRLSLVAFPFFALRFSFWSFSFQRS